MIGVKDKFNDALGKGAETAEYVKAYADSQFKLKKLEISRTVGKTTAKIIEIAVAGVLVSLALLFALVAFTFWLATQLASYPLAFLIIAGGLLFIVLLFSLLKGVLVRKPAQRKADKMLFKEGLPTETEADLRHRVKVLEKLLEDSVKDIPNTFSDLNAKDFIPEKINNIAESGFVKGFTGLVGSKKKRSSANKFVKIATKIASLALGKKK